MGTPNTLFWPKNIFRKLSSGESEQSLKPADQTPTKDASGGVGGQDVDHKNFGNPIDNKPPATRVEWQQAVDFLHSKLPKVASLKALVELDLTGDNPHVFVDTRSDNPTITSNCPSSATPDVKIRTRALTLQHFGSGLMDTRYASHFNQIQISGNSLLAIKFLDLLSPTQPSSPPPLNSYSRLPVPTTDLAQVKRDVREFGYGLVADALSPAQISALQTRLAEQAEGEVAAGVSYFDGGPLKPNQRIWNLPNKGAEFLELLEHPLVEEFMPDFLGDGYHLSSFTANINRPGSKDMAMHTDQITINPAIPHFPLGLNLMWFLCDVDEENGGTRILPKSHAGLVAPDNMFDIEGTTFARGKAGTCLVFESRLWHATGPNVVKPSAGKNGERPVILQFYVRHFVRPQENFTMSVAPEIEQKLSDKAKQALGFRVTATLGGVEGFKRDGTFVRRPERPVVGLRADGSKL